MSSQPKLPPSSPEPQDVREALRQVLASLVGAVSLLKKGGKVAKKSVASDKMFDQIIRDYENAIEQGRAALAQSDTHGEAIPDCPTEGVAARQGNGG